MQYLGTNNSRPGPSLKPTLEEKRNLEREKAKFDNIQDAYKQGLNTKEAKPHDDIFSIDWRNLERIYSIRQNGTDGVFFAQTAENLTFVIKGSSRPQNEYFTSMLYANLGIRVPRFRILSLKDQNAEFREMLLGLDWACKEIP